MKLGAIPCLLLAQFCVPKAAIKMPEFKKVDYYHFGNVRLAELSELEKRILDPLYRHCAAYACPECPLAAIDERLTQIATDEKSRGIVLTVLAEYAYPALLERKLLAEFGYASHLLLRKLFRGRYAYGLNLAPGTLCACSLRREFTRRVARSLEKLRKINGVVSEALASDASMGLTRLVETGGEHSGSVDLAIYMLRVMGSLGAALLTTAFQQLVDSWAGDIHRREKLLPVVTGVIRIVQQPKMFDEKAQQGMRKHVVEYVMRTNEPECFSLFNGFYMTYNITQYVFGLVDRQKYAGVDPWLILNYIEYSNTLERSEDRSERLFDALLPSFAEFHVSKTSWNSDARFFNAISYRWLLRMFDDLHASAAKYANLSELMEDYMKMLGYPVFIDMLKAEQIAPKRKKLVIFMLKHQKEEKMLQYKEMLYHSINTDNAMSNHIVSILRLLARLYSI